MAELLIPLMLLIPLGAALANGINAFSGDRLFDWRSVQRITVGAAGVAFACALLLFIDVLRDPTPRTVVLYEWLSSDSLTIEAAVLVDTLSALMALLVTGFSFVIGRFSINYMHRETGFTRFFAALALFIFAMLLLVMSDNFVLMFVGWEGVGVCSYLLIGQYLDRNSPARASTEAFIANRVGDAGFIVGILTMINTFGSVRYEDVFAKLGDADPGTLTFIALCLLLGAVSKSALFPLGGWLAKAMEGPTPSSALFYGSVMVTAGVYLVVRAHPLFDAAPHALLVVALVGACTALYGALVGQTVTDIKGLLATSTHVQVGLMFLACGLGAYGVAVFHMTAHAFFKAYRFLTAASILHLLHGRLDPATQEAKQEVPSLYTVIALLAGLMVVVPVLSSLGAEAGSADGWSVRAWVLLAGAALAVASAAHYGQVLTQRAFVDDGHGHAHGDAAHAGCDHGHDHGHGHAHSHGHDHAAPAASDQQSAPLGPVVWPLGLVAAAAIAGLALELLPGGLEGSWFRGLLAPVVGTGAGRAEGAAGLKLALALVLVALVAYAWFSAMYLTRYRAESALGMLVRKRQLYVASVNRFWVDTLTRRLVVDRALGLGRAFDRFDVRVIDRIVGFPAAVAGRLGRVVSWLDHHGVGAAERSPKALASHLSSVMALLESFVIGGLEAGLRAVLAVMGRIGAAFEGAIATPVVAVVLIAVVTVAALLGVR